MKNVLRDITIISFEGDQQLWTKFLSLREDYVENKVFFISPSYLTVFDLLYIYHWIISFYPLTVIHETISYIILLNKCNVFLLRSDRHIHFFHHKNTFPILLNNNIYLFDVILCSANDPLYSSIIYNVLNINMFAICAFSTYITKCVYICSFFYSVFRNVILNMLTFFFCLIELSSNHPRSRSRKRTHYSSTSVQFRFFFLLALINDFNAFKCSSILFNYIIMWRFNDQTGNYSNDLLNKSFNGIFVSSMNGHYSNWLRGNRCLWLQWFCVIIEIFPYILHCQVHSESV